MKPFEITRWDAPTQPEQAVLTRIMQREGLTPSVEELEVGVHTPEIKYHLPVVRILVQGTIQYSFPGYGVVELFPGDQLDIGPEVLHDVKNTGQHKAILLTASR